MMEENIFGHAAEYWGAALAWLLSVVNKTSQKKREAKNYIDLSFTSSHHCQMDLNKKSLAMQTIIQTP